MMDVVTTAVSGSFYCFSSVAAAMVSVLVETTADAVTIVDAAHHGTTAVETTAETAVAANFFGNGPGGIFGCPSCHGSNPAMIETLKLFLPYFPLHIQNLIRMYLKLLEFMHTFEMIQNMMNHMDEYQTLFQAFENMGNGQSSENPIATMASLFGNSGFTMPDISSMQKMMEGSDLVDEFTYVEEPSGTGWYGS
jgi:hypothetical protein